MNKDIKKRWVEALRSGKYKQGTGSLCKLGRDNKPRHCCLGVLIEMMSSVDLSKGHGFWPDVDILYEKAGLFQDNRWELIYKNDTQRCKFSTIANYIEENL